MRDQIKVEFKHCEFYLHANVEAPVVKERQNSPIPPFYNTMPLGAPPVPYGSPTSLYRENRNDFLSKVFKSTKDKAQTASSDKADTEAKAASEDCITEYAEQVPIDKPANQQPQSDIIASLEAENKQLRNELEKASTEHERQIRSWRKDMDGSAATVKELRTNNDCLRSKLDFMNAENAQLRKVIDQLVAEGTKIGRELHRLRKRVTGVREAQGQKVSKVIEDLQKIQNSLSK